MKSRHKPRIGFSLLRGGGGPSIFLRRLRNSINEQSLASVSYFFNPLNDINIYSNVVRNPLKKPYLFRVDGIYFDQAFSESENRQRNAPIFDGMDKATGIVFQSEFSYECVCRFHGKPTRPYTIIHNGIDLTSFSDHGKDKRSSLGIAPEDLVFVSSANWRAHKRLKDIVDVFLKYEKTSSRNCHLLILGDTGANSLIGNQKLHYVGHVSPKELPEWYRTADVCLFFSWLDPCPNTVVEMLASGIPVICTDQGGTRELVESANGGVVAQADRPFSFEPVYLYEPPNPNHEILLLAIEQVVDQLDSFSRGIDRLALDINTAASRYVEFVDRILRL